MQIKSHKNTAHTSLYFLNFFKKFEWGWQLYRPPPPSPLPLQSGNRVKEKKSIKKFVTDDIEISSDDSDEENSDKENFDEEN